MADARADTALGQLYIGVRPQPFVAGLGYWIVPDAASGLATRAVQLGSTQALQTLGAARVEAWAAVNNQPYNACSCSNSTATCGPPRTNPGRS
jgi:[ribosomal protein S5]-alanine N-acetyltransferase